MNIHLHPFHAKGAVTDQVALEQFQKQWATYQKLVDTDFLAHKEVGAILHGALQAMPKPFAFLDIACGDAGQMKRALAGTNVNHYHGIDLSAAGSIISTATSSAKWTISPRSGAALSIGSGMARSSRRTATSRPLIGNEAMKIMTTTTPRSRCSSMSRRLRRTRPIKRRRRPSTPTRILPGISTATPMLP